LIIDVLSNDDPEAKYRLLKEWRKHQAVINSQSSFVFICSKYNKGE